MSAVCGFCWCGGFGSEVFLFILILAVGRLRGSFLHINLFFKLKQISYVIIRWEISILRHRNFYMVRSTGKYAAKKFDYYEGGGKGHFLGG